MNNPIIWEYALVICRSCVWRYGGKKDKSGYECSMWVEFMMESVTTNKLCNTGWQEYSEEGSKFKKRLELWEDDPVIAAIGALGMLSWELVSVKRDWIGRDDTWYREYYFKRPRLENQPTSKLSLSLPIQPFYWYE
jgi:hypothetical protein